MSEAEKIYEGSTVVVKATMLQEHTAKLKKVTFKFFQDGEAATTDELCEESEFVKELTVADVGNGTEEDNIEGYDVIVHRVCAPKVPDDKDSYLFNYHLFYEVENGDGKIVKNQDLSPQQYRVFPRTAKLKVTWNEDGEPFHELLL